MAGKILSWVLALLFIVAGVPKVLGVAAVAEQFQQFGYPAGFRVLIGVLEIAGGVGLLTRRLKTVAVALLGAIMVGALATVVRAGMSVAPPAIVGSLLLVLAYLGERSPAPSEVRR